MFAEYAAMYQNAPVLEGPPFAEVRARAARKARQRKKNRKLALRAAWRRFWGTPVVAVSDRYFELPPDFWGVKCP